MISNTYHSHTLKTITFLCFLLNIACNVAENHPSNTTNILQENSKPKIIDKPFGIEFGIEKLDNKQYNILFTIELDSGTYIISPHSQDTFYMHFDVSLEISSHLIVDDALLEIPNSIEEYDAIIDTPVRFVRENTTYKQKVKVTTQDDFEVSGLIKFLLEPSCVPYHVEFVLSHHAGKMNIEKTDTKIPSYYRGR